MKKLLLLTMLGLSIFACKESSDVGGVTLQLSAQEMVLRVESTETLSVAGPAEWVNSEIVWTSTNSEVATVDKNGVVTGVKEGSSKIYAFVNNADAVRAFCAVTVSNVEASKIEAFLVTKGGDYTVETDRRSEIRSKYDTLDLVYVYTPSNAYLKTTIMRSDSVGDAVLEISKEVADEDTRGVWRAQVTGTGRIDKVKLTVVSADDDKMKSNVLEVDVKANVDYEPTKGMTAYQKEVLETPLRTLYANHIDTLVITDLPSDGAFAPFVWRVDDSNFQVTPFSYKNKAKETVWGAQISVNAAGKWANVYAKNADGNELYWGIRSDSDTSTNKKIEVSFGEDSLSMAINGTQMIPNFGITYNMAITDDNLFTLSFIPRPAKNTTGVNKKWWLGKDQTAIPANQLPGGTEWSSYQEEYNDERYVWAMLGFQGQGEALAIITLKDNKGITASDTMAFTVAGFDMETPWNNRNIAELYATYNSQNFGKEVVAKAKLFNYQSNSITLDEAELFIKKGTEVTPGTILEKDKSIVTITINKDANFTAGVEGVFTAITPKYASEIEGYAIKFTFTNSGITYTAVRDAAPDQGVPFAAPVR